MKKDIRHKFSFDAVDDDAKTHALHVFVEIIDAGTLDDPNAEVEGIKRIRTDSGDDVNRLEQGRYKVVATGQILRSDDPNAP